MKRFSPFSWLWFVLGLLYFFVPLISTFEFSLRMLKGRYTFEAYRVAFQDPRFYTSFGYSLLWAIITMVCSLLLVVPTAYWVQLRLPKLRPYVEFVTLMPFVVPAVVLIFGLIRIYGRPPLVLTTTPAHSSWATLFSHCHTCTGQWIRACVPWTFEPSLRQRRVWGPIG